ncbi:MAG: sodium:solute symporter family protein, partial [Planctomycetota bacterium]|jgi:SSS family solute:Na+ symporter
VAFTRKTAGDYFLASRSIGPFLLVMSVFGTTMTAFALVGSSGEAFKDGIGVYGMMASWSGIIHSACFFLIGVKLWSLGKRYGYTTQIQYFRDRFESPLVGSLLFPVLVALVIPYLLIGILAGGATIESVTAGAFPWWFSDTKGAIPAHVGSGVICVVVLIYVFGGGLRSTAWANALQTCVFMALGVITFIVIATKLGGLKAASDRVAEARPDLLARGGAGSADGASISHLRFLTYAFIPLSVAMFPHLFQHWMTAKSAKTFRPTVILHPIFIMIVWVPCVLVGIWATSAVLGGQLVVPPDLKNPNAVLGIMVKKLTNPYLTGLLTVGILAAIMSSLDSQFLCIGSMFTHDVVLHHFGQHRFTDRQRILLGRLFVLGIVVVAYLLSLGEPKSVFTMGVWCFSGFASLFPLVFASLYWKRVTRAGAMASVLVAAAVWLLLFRESGWGDDRAYLFLGMMPVATIFVCATAALVLVSWVTTPPSEAVLARFFSPAASTQATQESPSLRASDDTGGAASDNHSGINRIQTSRSSPRT